MEQIQSIYDFLLIELQEINVEKENAYSVEDNHPIEREENINPEELAEESK